MVFFLFSIQKPSFVLGLTFAAHFLLIAAIVVTIATFTISERVYKFKEGYHSANRARGTVIYRDQDGNPYIVDLPKNDPGGEHE